METKAKSTRVVVGVLALAGLLLVWTLATAGNLEPSAPPGPTMKTLDEVEPRTPISSLPYTISASGSYYLTSNLTGGITVNADNVTIDLMGYSLIGSGSGIDRGIDIDGRSNVEIRNGTVRDFGLDGISEAGSAKGGYRVIGIRAVSNGDRGIYLTGDGHLVKDCTALENGDDGIFVAGSGGTVTGNIAYNNGYTGIYVSSGCTVTGNTVEQNGRCGILTATGCTVTGNTAISNNQYNSTGYAGIKVSSNCLVKGNTVSENNQNNIYVYSSDNAIEENLVTDSNNGIYFKVTGNFYANNRASGNVTDYNDVPVNFDGGGNASF